MGRHSNRARNRFCLTDTIDRQMGFYALRDGRVAAFTVHRNPDPALPDDAQRAVREAYSSLGWVVPQALAKCPPSPELYYDLLAQIEIPHWSRGRVALLGVPGRLLARWSGRVTCDAGAYVLGAQLANADSLDAALARYQQVWQLVITEKQRIARRGATWFLPSSSPQRWLRRSVLNLTALPGVDRFVGTALVGKSSVTLHQLSGSQPDLSMMRRY